jgi:MYXO-CTERM domain-containing protein
MRNLITVLSIWLIGNAGSISFDRRHRRERATALVIASLALALVWSMAQTSNAEPLLWNTLGSAAEVTNSAYGPNLGFYGTNGTDGVPDMIGNPDYVPGVFGNAVGIGAGNYGTFAGRREHTIIWSDVDQYLNPDRGTIEAWFIQNSDPVAFDHGVYRIFDGSYGLGSGIGMTSEIPTGPDPLLYFGMDFGGDYSGVTCNISSYNGTWIHLAGVWDRNGIDNTADTIRLYLDGNLVAATTVSGWGTTVGQFADIAGGNDHNIAGQFAVDNLKVYDTAMTDFSNRFDESALPEPAFGMIALLALVPRRRRRR